MLFYLLAIVYLLPPKITISISLIYLILGSIYLLIDYKRSKLLEKKQKNISYDEKFQKFLSEEEKEDVDFMFTTGKHK